MINTKNEHFCNRHFNCIIGKVKMLLLKHFKRFHVLDRGRNLPRKWVWIWERNLGPSKYHLNGHLICPGFQRWCHFLPGERGGKCHGYFSNTTFNTFKVLKRRFIFINRKWNWLKYKSVHGYVLSLKYSNQLKLIKLTWLQNLILFRLSRSMPTCSI